MSCYRTILVAVDGSADAAAALRHATSLARDQHAKLILLTVVPAPPPQVAGPAALLAPPVESDAPYVRILRDAVDTVPPDVGVQTRLARGRPARRILETARECGCDLIVMGFHGHGRLHHALIGSVSDSVLLDSGVPVLLMRAELGTGGVGAAVAGEASAPAPAPALAGGADARTADAGDVPVVSGPLR